MSFNWSDFWNAIQALAVFATAIIAFSGLRTWRQQLVGGRKFEIAEATVMTVYQLRMAVKEIRNPLVFGSEIEDALKDFGDNPTPEQEKAARFYVTLHRMKPFRDLITELEMRRIECKVHFEADSEPLLELSAVFWRDIAWAARELGDDALEGGNLTGDKDREKSIRKWRRVIWAGPRGSDEIETKIEREIMKIEEICRPHLK